MSSMQTPFVCIALARLRRGVLVCCWLIALSLIAQLLVWATAMFTDVRHHTVLVQASASPLIVNQAEKVPQNAPAISTSDKSEAVATVARTTPAATGMKVPDANRVPSKYDRMMKTTSDFAAGIGMLAIIALLPLLAVGAIMGAGSATPGVEHAVSAFTWSIILAMLILPLGEMIGLPVKEGALYVYSNMTHQVDAAHSVDDGWASPTFYARFAVLPLACIVAVAIIGLRFCAGVGAGMPVVESMRLDPVLEREAANITPGSLHGGRGAAALRGVAMGNGNGNGNGNGHSAAPASPPRQMVAAGAGAPPPGPGMMQPSPGVAPKRLI